MRLIDADALIANRSIQIVIGAGDNICVDIADIEKAPTIEMKPNWISVKDRMPKYFVSVLGHMTDAGYFPSVRECYNVGHGFFFPALKEIHPIDFWMEMPEPPKEG